MYVRFWPLLWMVCVPLVSAGALPHPAVAACAAAPAAYAVGPRPVARAATPIARASPTAASAPARDRRLDMVGLRSVSGQGAISAAVPLLVGAAVAVPDLRGGAVRTGTPGSGRGSM